MASVNMKQEEPSLFHLKVGTEVSAKYRGAFCEAQIKSIKRNVTYKVVSKKTGKSFHLSEDNIKGDLKIGSVVEALLPDQTAWQECVLQSAKDKSLYTVVFDDADERTLARGSLCLKGDRHYAKSETLDNLPLTDPENFGTPVLAKKKNRRRRPVDDDYDDESEGHKTPDREAIKVKEKKHSDAKETYSSSEDEEEVHEKRARWLADPLMGRVVIVEPHDKRKHWFPGLVVNPLCSENHEKLQDDQLVVRSFKTGKLFRAYQSCVKEMSPVTIPTKLDSIWKGAVEAAQNWQRARVIPNCWRMDISNIFDSDNNVEEESSEDDSKRSKKTDDEKADKVANDATTTDKDKSNHDFLEELYKFMEDRGSPINKTPVLGYKDLNLYRLYRLVQKRQGSFAISAIKEWKQIYLDLGIPKPNPAAGYNVKTAYQKYLGAYEEYCTSWRHIQLHHAKSQPTPMTKERKKTKQTPQGNKQASEVKKIKDKDVAKGKSLESSTEAKTRAGRNSPVVNIGPLPRPRRRISESSSASDITNPAAKPEKKKTGKGPKKNDNKRSSIGPDSEQDESSKDEKVTKKECGEKRQPSKSSFDVVAPKRMRRNSTSSVQVQYSVGDKLKVKYGQGQTFKIYDAKVLRVKTLEALGNPNEYYVHYAGWNARHDEWIPQSYIVSFAEEKAVPSPAASSGKSLSKRPRTPINSRSSSMSKDDLTPSPNTSYDINSKFASVESDVPNVDDDLPDFQVKKPRVASIFKKNLGDEFRKSCTSGNPLVEVKPTFGPFVVDAQNIKLPFDPPHLGSLPELKQTMQNEKSKEKRLSAAKAKEQDKQSCAIGEATKTDANVKSEVKEIECNEPDCNREGSISPGTGSSSVSETSEDNSNNSDSPVQVRRTSGRHSKLPVYYEGGYVQTGKRKKQGGSSDKSRSPTPENVDVSESNAPECIAESDATSQNTAAATDDSPNKEANNTSSSSSMEICQVDQVEASVSTPIPDIKVVPSSKESLKEENDDTSIELTSGDTVSNDAVKSELISSEISQYTDKKENVPLSGENEMSSTSDTGSIESSSSINEQSEEDIPEESTSLTEEQSKMQIKSPSEDTDSLSSNEQADTEQTLEASISTKETNVVEPVAESVNDGVDQHDDNTSIHPPPDLEAEADHVPEPHQPPILQPISPPLQTPLSSSKVLLENTPPTTPEQSPTYTSEEQDIEPEKHSPNIDSDVPDIVDEHKYSGGSASSSGCEQPTTSENPHAITIENASARSKRRSPGACGKKKMERPNRSNNKRQGRYNDSESEDDHDTTNHRKRRASTSKYKPRKKKAKARPEPPSAPPPLPREKLDGMSQDERISLLQARMAEMRKIYHQLKQEVANIDRKRKRAKRREREAAEAHSLASNGGLTLSTPSKAAVKSDVAASSTVETEPVSKGKDEHK